jgi:hypothetical protein
MTIILEDTIERYVVRETTDGLDVYEDDNLVCELEGYTLRNFYDEWENIDEDELYQAIQEEIELDETMAKLKEQW